jgi:Gamma-glutamyl cyclotransferase, AIG2-like
MGGLTDNSPTAPHEGAGGLPSDYVFGYGSLASDLVPHGAVARLQGYRRVFGVAADNSEEIAGYKRYRCAGDGSFPDVHVAFLDIVRDADTAVNGVLAPVAATALADLDRRERNYDRVDVTAAIESPPEGRVWAYVGSPDGRARLEAGVAAGNAVVQRRYLEHVHSGFRRLGEDEYHRFLATSHLDGLPQFDLQRVDLPPEEPPR